MKGLAVGVLVGAALALVSGLAIWSPQPVLAQAKSTGSPGENAVVVLSSPLAEGGQQLLVVDPVERVVCVYHISGKNGEIALKSVRNIHWDLRMSQFNGVSPLPQEIRSLVEQR